MYTIAHAGFCLYTPSRPRNGFIIDHFSNIVKQQLNTSALFLIHSLTHSLTVYHSIAQHTTLLLISFNISNKCISIPNWNCHTSWHRFFLLCAVFLFIVNWYRGNVYARILLSMVGNCYFFSRLYLIRTSLREFTVVTINEFTQLNADSDPATL